MAELEAPFFDHHAWDQAHEEGVQDGEEFGGEGETESQAEAHLSRSQGDLKGALDQRIARVLGNLDKVVKDPTRGGAMAGDYGTFMPVQVRGKAVPQSFVRDTGIDIPSLGPPLEPAAPREAPLSVLPEPRPKTAAKKTPTPASTFLVNIDPSLAPTDSSKPSKPFKPLKVKTTLTSPKKVKSWASPGRGGESGSSPAAVRKARPLASTPPGSPLLNSDPNPSSNTSTPDRSPGSILRIMTASAVPWGACLSPLGELAPWTKPARPSRLNSVLEMHHERLADKEGAMDTSGGDGESPAKFDAQKAKIGKEHKKSLTKKRVEERQKNVDRGEEPERTARGNKERVEDQLDGFLAPIAGVESEVGDLFGRKQVTQPREGRRQLLQQLSVDQERLKAFLEEGDNSGGLLQRIPHANLKEIEQLRKDIERTEEKLRQKLLEDSESSSAESGQEGGHEAGWGKSSGLGLEREDARGAHSAARVHSAKKRGDTRGVVGGKASENVEGGSEEKASTKRGESETPGQISRSPVLSKEEIRRRLKEELRKVKAERENLPGGEGAGKGSGGNLDHKASKVNGEKGPSSVEQAVAHEKKGPKGEHVNGPSGASGQMDRKVKDEGVGRESAPGVEEGIKKEGQSSKKKKKRLVSVSTPAREESLPKVKATGGLEEPGGVQETSGKKLKKKRDWIDSADGSKAGGKSGVAHRIEKNRAAVDKEPQMETDAQKSRAMQAAAREALPEAQQRDSRRAAATAKLVQQGQVGSELVPLGPRIEGETDEYVCCDRCNKWRVLPYWLHQAQFEKINWTCNDLDWLDPEYADCSVDQVATDNQMKYINYPPVGGWQKITEDLKRLGLIRDQGPSVASPVKPKRSVFQTQQGHAEVSGSLRRTTSAREKKDTQSGGQKHPAGSPLGRRKRLLKEGELRKKRVVLANDDSESGDEEWGGLTKSKNKKLKKEQKEIRQKRRVLSDDDESEEEGPGRAGGEPTSGATEGRTSAGEGKERRENGVVEEQDWVLDEEEEGDKKAAQPDKIVAASAGGLGQPQRGEKMPKGYQERSRGGEEKERKQKMDGREGERHRKKKARIEATGRSEVEEGKGLREEWKEKELGQEKAKEPGGVEERAFKKKKLKVKKLAEVMKVDRVLEPAMPGSSAVEPGVEVTRSDMEGPKEKIEKAVLEKKKKQRREETTGEVKQSVPMKESLLSDTTRVVENGEKERGPVSPEAGGDVRAPLKGEVPTSEQKGGGANGILELKVGGILIAGAVHQELSTVEALELTSEKRSDIKNAVKVKQEGGVRGPLVDGADGNNQSKQVEQARAKAVEENKGVTDSGKRGDETGAKVGDEGEHPFLEDEDGANDRGGAGGPVESVAGAKSWVPRQVQVAKKKVVSRDDEQSGKVGGRATLGRDVETTSKEGKEDGKGPTETKPGPTVASKTAVTKAEDGVKLGDTSSERKSAPSGDLPGGGSVEAKQGKGSASADTKFGVGTKGRKRGRAQSLDSSSSSSSSDVSSDSSELAEEDVGVPGKGAKNPRSRSPRDPHLPSTSRSTVLHTLPRRELSPLNLGRRAQSEERDSPPPSRAKRRDRDRDGYRPTASRDGRRHSPSRRGERERRYRDEKDRDERRSRERERGYSREYERGERYRRRDSPPRRDWRGGSERLENDRRRSRMERDDERGPMGERSRSRSRGKEGGPAGRADAASRGASRQLSPWPETGVNWDGRVQKKGGQTEAEKTLSTDIQGKGPLAKVHSEPAQATPPQGMKEGGVSTPALEPKAPSEPRIGGAMAPPPPPAAASGPAAGGAHDEAHRLFQKLMKEAKDTKHTADNLKIRSEAAIAATVYVDAALKFLLAAASIEIVDAKQASTIYRETADFIEGLCVGFFRSHAELAGLEALAWKCGAVARTHALQAVKDRLLKDRASLHDCLAPGTSSRPPSAGVSAAAGPPVTAHQAAVGTPPDTIVIVESPSSLSAFDGDAAAQTALSLGGHQREPLNSLLHAVHEHFAITTSWNRAATLSAQAAKALSTDAFSALNAVGENGGLGSLESIIQAARIALNKIGA